MKMFQGRFWLSVVLTLTVYMTMSPAVALAQYECQPVSTTAPTTGALTAADPTQAGRIVRDGRPSSCTGKTNTLQNTTPVVADSYNFTAPSTGCATLTFNNTACAANLSTMGYVAYSTYTPATPQTGVIGDPGFSSTGTGSFSFPVTQGQNFTIAAYDVLETPTNAFCPNYSFTISYSTTCRQAGFDNNNDGSAELNVFRPSTSQWFSFNSATGALTTTNTFGISTDTPVIGDYNGNGNSEPAVFRAGNSTWYAINTPGNPVTDFSVTPWGTAGDIPVPGDYDRDGKTDVNVWRPSNGTWYTLRSSNNTLSTFNWGALGDVPYTGDFDGDLVNDFGVNRVTPAGVQHFILESNFAQGFFLQPVFGSPSDLVAIGDYDGDAKSDLTVFRPASGDWYINQSSVIAGNPIRVIHFGQTGDIPQPADYDGDKKTDLAVYRPSNGAFYYLRSIDNVAVVLAVGSAGDMPASAPYANAMVSPVR